MVNNIQSWKWHFKGRVLLNYVTGHQKCQGQVCNYMVWVTVSVVPRQSKAGLIHSHSQSEPVSDSFSLEILLNKKPWPNITRKNNHSVLYFNKNIIEPTYVIHFQEMETCFQLVLDRKCLVLAASFKNVVLGISCLWNHIFRNFATKVSCWWSAVINNPCTNTEV